ncbi:GNAT family N-acetyltransferase [Acidovorax lacteus]
MSTMPSESADDAVRPPTRIVLPHSSTVRWRREAPQDAQPLRALRMAVRAADFALLGLAPAQLQALCAQQVDSQWQQYRARFPDVYCEVAEQAGSLVGAMAWRSERGGAAALHLVDIGVHPQWQSQGLGTAMLRGLMACADAHALPVRLEVLRHSRARDWYIRWGFAPVDGAGLTMHETLVRPAQRP